MADMSEMAKPQQLNTTEQGTTILMGCYDDKEKDGIETVAVFADATAINCDKMTPAEKARFRQIMEANTSCQEKNQQLSQIKSVVPGKDVKEKIQTYADINTIAAFAGARAIQDNYAAKFNPTCYDQLKEKLKNGISDVLDACVKNDEYFSARILLIHLRKGEGNRNVLGKELMHKTDRARAAPNVYQLGGNYRVVGIHDPDLEAEMASFFTPEEGHMRKSYTRKEVSKMMQAMMHGISKRQKKECGKRFTSKYCTGAYINAAGEIYREENNRESMTQIVTKATSSLKSMSSKNS